MVVHMRHTRAHTANRRSHHALKLVRLSKCPKCGTQNVRHTACKVCGTYRGREVFSVLPKTKGKKEAKPKAVKPAKKKPAAKKKA